MGPRHRAALEAAERYADGLLSETEFQEAMEPIFDLRMALPIPFGNGWGPAEHLTAILVNLGGGEDAGFVAREAAFGVARLAAGQESPKGRVGVVEAERAAQCDLLRDVIGSPFFPFEFDPAWLSGKGQPVVELARALERDGRLGNLTVLARALTRAGCSDRAVLKHCCQQETHVRGCWVVDALLGRESALRMGLTTEAHWRTCADPEPLLDFLMDKGSKRKWRLFAVACCRRVQHLMRDERSRQVIEIAARYIEGSVPEEEMRAALGLARDAHKAAEIAKGCAERESEYDDLTPKYAAALSDACAAQAPLGIFCRDGWGADAGTCSDEVFGRIPSHICAADAAGLRTVADLGHGRTFSALALQAAGNAAERQAQCELIRDLFGDCFGPPWDQGCWLSWRSPSSFPPRSGLQWCLLPTRVSADIRPEWLTWNEGVVVRLAQSIYHNEAFDRLAFLGDVLEDAGCTNLDILNHCRQPRKHARGCWVLDAILARE